jgi:hypothetical protein
MCRRAARFTEADAFRAAKAAKRAGMAVEIEPDGTIRIVPFEPRRSKEAPPPAPSKDENYMF